MRKKLKLITTLIAITIFALSMTTISSAATYNSDNIVSPMSEICPNCGNGYMITSSNSKTYHDHYEVCTIRNDCMITVKRIETIHETHCSDCGYGTTWISYNYTSTHSKSH